MTTTFLDRVRMTVASAPGTGSIALGSAVSGYQTFAAAGAVNGSILSYVIEDTSGHWEIGHGTYSTSGPALARTTVLASSNSGAAISATSAAIVYTSLFAEDLSGLGGGGGTTLSKDRFAPPATTLFTTAVGTNSVNPTMTSNSTEGAVISFGQNPASGDNIRMMCKSITGTSWTVIARMKTLTHVLNYSGAGLVVYDSSSGKIAFFFLSENTGNYSTSPAMAVLYLTSNTTFSGSAVNQTWLSLGHFTPEWYKIAYTSATTPNFTFSASHDGVNWLDFAAENITDFGSFSPDHVGFGIHVNKNSGAWSNYGPTDATTLGLLYCYYYSDPNISPGF